jgi:polar amino acid transport system substrate-binding protein
MTETHHRPRRALAGLAALASLAVAAAGCGGGGGSSSAGSSAKGVDLVHSGQLTACSHLPYKPFEFTKGGKVVGFDVSMVDLLGTKLGVPTKVVNIGWAQITSGGAFAAGKCDVGMGAATITPERKQSVRFSDPYFDATQALLVKDEAAYRSLADLKGKKLGVQTDTTGQLYAKKHAGKSGYTTVVYPDSLSEFNGLKSGAVDAAINDNGPEYNFAKNNPGTEVTKKFGTGEHYGFMVKKNDKNAAKLAGKLNDVIAQSKKDGRYDKIYQKWFGKLPEKVNKGG